MKTRFVKLECPPHCWHAKRGPIWMVLKDGHIVQQCCHCTTTRTVHADHAREKHS